MAGFTSGGKSIIVSAPSGAGKTTIVKYLLQAELGLEFSVSACSRPIREGETDGRDYYFLTPETFRQKIENEEFVEWEEVYPGCYYGTLKSAIQQIWDKGHHVIFDVDVVGGMNLKKIFGAKSLSLFIMPPSLNSLEERLRKRSSDPEDSLRKRLSKARFELEQKGFFDHIILNDHLETACTDAKNLVSLFLFSPED